jgi:hypothetical protein
MNRRAAKGMRIPLHSIDLEPYAGVTHVLIPNVLFGPGVAGALTALPARGVSVGAGAWEARR